MTERRELATISDYASLHAALRARADALGASRNGLDELSGLPLGYTAKLLSPVPIKAIGRTSLGPLLGALGCALVLVEDLAAVQRISARLKKRNDAHVRMRTVPRPKKRAKLGSAWGKVMAARRVLLQPAATRKRLAKRAAIFRWKDVRDAARRP